MHALHTRHPSIVDHALLIASGKVPLSSMRELAKATGFSVPTLYSHWTRSLGFTVSTFAGCPIGEPTLNCISGLTCQNCDCSA
jgi:hypothetical protein